MTRRPSPSAGGPRPGERRPFDPALVSADVNARVTNGYRTLVATGGQALARLDEMSLSQRRNIANAQDAAIDTYRRELNPDEGN